MSEVPTVTLNGGMSIPQLGLGVFQIPPGDTAEAVGVALDAGYRHIDTAEMYENEKQVGHGVRDSGLNRSDVFITSKDAPVPTPTRSRTPRSEMRTRSW
jgi:2,5-diketo-D-gluconate reductase A